jgi:hypothetical protein
MPCLADSASILVQLHRLVHHMQQLVDTVLLSWGASSAGYATHQWRSSVVNVH